MTRRKCIGSARQDVLWVQPRPGTRLCEQLRVEPCVDFVLVDQDTPRQPHQCKPGPEVEPQPAVQDSPCAPTAANGRVAHDSTLLSARIPGPRRNQTVGSKSQAWPGTKSR